ncbi:MAG TPA: DUF4340 domain-containing protein [Archangium sp.]|nr:DUF4340 domain-containing protein [Archangium sp.]
MNAKQKNLLSLLVGALVAGGLGLYAYFGVMKPEQKETQRKQADTALFAGQGAGEQGQDAGTAPGLVFTTLTVEARGSRTVMEVKDGVWRVTSPVSSRADRRLVEGLVKQLGSAKFRATVEENPTDADLERYALKPPLATVTVQAYVPDAQGGGADDPARQRTLTFHSGAENPFDGSVYVRREGDPRVYSADGALRFALEKHTNDWRDHTLFNLTEPSLLRIEVKARKHAYTLERTTTDKVWKLVRPVEMPADAERVAQLVTTLTDYKALTFPSAELEPSLRAALEKPQVEARFVPTLGEPLRMRFVEVQAEQVEGMKQVYALVERGAESQLAQVDPYSLVALDLDVPEFKDKKALAFQGDQVHHIVIHPAPRGETLKLSKALDSSKWEVVEPMPAQAREFKVASLLGALERLKASALGEPRPKSWSKYGISDTSRGVSLLDADGKELVRLRLGTEVKGNPQRLWARGSAEEVLELEKSTIDGLPLKFEDLVQTGVPAASPTP